MLVVPRASTHLEYTDIPLVLPASRWGQALSSVYVQRWLDRYLKGVRRPRALLAGSFRYLEPAGRGVWKEVRLDRDALLRDRYCSAYAFGRGAARRTDLDWSDVGCCRSAARARLDVDVDPVPPPPAHLAARHALVDAAPFPSTP